MNLDPTAIQALAGRLRTLASDLEILLRPEPVVEHPSFDAPALPANPAVSVTNPGAWQYVKLTEEYRSLLAIIGNGKIKSEAHWLPWGRLVEKWGWKNLTKGAEATDPLNRWPGNIEQTIINKKRSKESLYQ